MTEDVLMSRNHSVKYLNRMTLRCKMLCLLAVMSLCHLRAQDALPLQAVVDFRGLGAELLREGQHGGLEGRESRMEVQNYADVVLAVLVLSHHFLVVGLH